MVKRLKYVLGFLFDQQRERVVLILKNNPLWQAGDFNGVGGAIEASETPIAAMRREFFEEAGVTVKWEKFHTETYDRASVHCYRAFNSESMKMVEAGTKETVHVFWLDHLPNCLVKDVYRLMKKARE